MPAKEQGLGEPSLQVVSEELIPDIARHPMAVLVPVVMPELVTAPAAAVVAATLVVVAEPGQVLAVVQASPLASAIPKASNRAMARSLFPGLAVVQVAPPQVELPLQ
jgi:hypothetical protein